jgi:hypothetical protein
MIQNHFCDTEPFFAEYAKMVSLVFPGTPYQAEPFRGFCVLPDGRTPKKVLQNSFFFSEYNPRKKNSKRKPW